MTNYKSPTSLSSLIPTSTDKDSYQATKLLMNLINKSMASTSATNGLIPSATKTHSSDHVELRKLETWHDEDEEPLDESYYRELVDPDNPKGWSADEMFKYNEKMHKITSSYNERTISDNYTMPLPKTNSKTTRLAAQLAKEIQDRVIAEGRITPESSDDDEVQVCEPNRTHVIKSKQQKQIDQLKHLQRQTQFRWKIAEGLLMENSARDSSKTTKSPSQYSQNSTETPATISLSSSPTMNDCIKPVTSSSRNILRTCLT